MPRQKLISDSEVLDAALTLYGRDGNKGISFGTVGRATGLAPATLVQRFVSCEAMFAATIAHGWQKANGILQRVDAEMPANGQNAISFLKVLADALAALPLGAVLVASQGHELAALAGSFRQGVERSLLGRIEKGPNQKEEAAAAIFAAWQGRLLWQGTRGGEFRLRTFVKKK